MTYWQQLRQQVLERDNYTCQTCFRDAQDVHHIIPRRKHGLNVLDNLTSVCTKCHGLVEWKVKGYEKRYLFTIPLEIKKTLKYKAIDENTSVNSLVVKALRELLSKK